MYYIYFGCPHFYLKNALLTIGNKNNQMKESELG
jgi:hypothetical protein